MVVAIQFQSFRDYVIKLNKHREKVVTMSLKNRDSKIKTKVFYILVKNYREALILKNAIIIQKYVRKYLVQQIYYKQEIKRWKNVVKDRMYKRKITMRVYKTIYLLENIHDHHVTNGNWTNTVAKFYKHALKMGKYHVFTQIYIKNIHLELRKSARIRTSRSTIIGLLNSYQLIIDKNQETLRLDVFLIWLLLCARRNALDKYYTTTQADTPEVKEQSYIFRSPPIRSSNLSSNNAMKRLSNNSSMKFSAYKVMLKENRKKEKLEHNKEDDKYIGYPAILIDTLKEIDDAIVEKNYNYTKYQYFKESFYPKDEKARLVGFSKRQHVIK